MADGEIRWKRTGLLRYLLAIFAVILGSLSSTMQGQKSGHVEWSGDN